MNIALILAAQAAGQGSPMPMIIMMVAIFAIMWFLMIRPQQKKQKGGGIYGTVKHIDMTTNKVDVEIARGVVITVDKSYVFASVQASQQNQSK